MDDHRMHLSSRWALAALAALLLSIGVVIGWIASEAQIREERGVYVQVEKQVTRLVMVTQVVEVTVRETVWVERVVTATPPPPPTPRPTPSVGTRANPAPLGETLLYQDGDDISLVTITAWVTGDEAARRVAAANLFNEIATEGNEFVLFHARVTLSQTARSEAVAVTDYAWTLVDAEGRLWKPPSIVEPEPNLNGSGYEGATIEGWVVHTRRVGQPVSLVYDLSYKGTGGAWFAVP